MHSVHKGPEKLSHPVPYGLLGDKPATQLREGNVASMIQ